MKKLIQLEEKFYFDYPNGFEDEAFLDMEKKHKILQISDFVQENFSKDKFSDSTFIFEQFAKVISRSSLVSRFEKPAFKDFSRSYLDHKRFADCVYEMMHGNEKKGFELLVEILSQYKLAKWPIVTAFLAYKAPNEHVFIKPTTTKKIIKYFEADLFYQPKPTYEFYLGYKEFINDLKAKSSQGLQVHNPAYCGFLLLAIED